MKILSASVIKFCQPFVFLPTLALFKIFCHFKVQGLENLKDVKPGVILAANHVSEWDPILIRAAMPFFSHLAPTYYVSMAKEAYKTFGWRSFFYGGIIFELLGAYPIYSGNKDYEYSLQNHIKIIKQGGTLCIFPEGQIVREGMTPKPRGGVAFISHFTQSPIVPVAIKGLSNMTLWDFIARKRHVEIVFGKAIPADLTPNNLLSSEDYQSVSSSVLEKVRLYL